MTHLNKRQIQAKQGGFFQKLGNMLFGPELTEKLTKDNARNQDAYSKNNSSESEDAAIRTWLFRQLSFRKDRFHTIRGGKQDLVHGNMNGILSGLRVSTITWNVNRKSTPSHEELVNLIAENQQKMWEEAFMNKSNNNDDLKINHAIPDIIAIGLEEVDFSAQAFLLGETGAKRRWAGAFSLALNSYYESVNPSKAEVIGSNFFGAAQNKLQYVEVHSRQQMGICILVYVLRDLSRHISGVASGQIGTGLMKIGPNKGGVAVRLRVYETTLCFLCVHLAAHQRNVSRRNEDFAQVVMFTEMPSEEIVRYGWNRGLGGIVNESWESTDVRDDASDDLRFERLRQLTRHKISVREKEKEKMNQNDFADKQESNSESKSKLLKQKEQKQQQNTSSSINEFNHQQFEDQFGLPSPFRQFMPISLITLKGIERLQEDLEKESLFEPNFNVLQQIADEQEDQEQVKDENGSKGTVNKENNKNKKQNMHLDQKYLNEQEKDSKLELDQSDSTEDLKDFNQLFPFDVLIVLGDFNYRIDLPEDEIYTLLTCQIPKKDNNEDTVTSDKYNSIEKNKQQQIQDQQQNKGFNKETNKSAISTPTKKSDEDEVEKLLNQLPNRQTSMPNQQHTPLKSKIKSLPPSMIPHSQASMDQYSTPVKQRQLEKQQNSQEQNKQEQNNQQEPQQDNIQLAMLPDVPGEEISFQRNKLFKKNLSQSPSSQKLDRSDSNQEFILTQNPLNKSGSSQILKLTNPTANQSSLQSILLLQQLSTRQLSSSNLDSILQEQNETEQTEQQESQQQQIQQEQIEETPKIEQKLASTQSSIELDNIRASYEQKYSSILAQFTPDWRKRLNILRKNDQLQLQMKGFQVVRQQFDILGERVGQQQIQHIPPHTAFLGFREGRIRFAPTYKIKIGSDVYYRNDKEVRTPAWTDRILFAYRRNVREKENESDNREEIKEEQRQDDKQDNQTKANQQLIKNINSPLIRYDSLLSCRVSDHRAVAASFLFEVRLFDSYKFREMRNELLFALDKTENASQPSTKISTHAIELKVNERRRDVISRKIGNDITNQNGQLDKNQKKKTNQKKKKQQEQNVDKQSDNQEEQDDEYLLVSPQIHPEQNQSVEIIPSISNNNINNNSIIKSWIPSAFLISSQQQTQLIASPNQFNSQYIPPSSQFTVTNTGLVTCTYSFAPLPNYPDAIPQFLKIKPKQGVLFPGEQAKINVEFDVRVNNKTNINIGQIDGILENTIKLNNINQKNAFYKLDSLSQTILDSVVLIVRIKTATKENITQFERRRE
ncbi:MAG: hypothetical protein EZS28_027721, partial [Streblomastix strix]